MNNELYISFIYSIEDCPCKTLVLFSNGCCMLCDYQRCFQENTKLNHIVTGLWDITQRDERLILNFDKHSFTLLGLYFHNKSQQYIFHKKGNCEYVSGRNKLRTMDIANSYFNLSENLFLKTFIEFDKNHRLQNEKIENKLSKDTELIRHYMTYERPVYSKIEKCIDFLGLAFFIGGNAIGFLFLPKYWNIAVVCITWILFFILPWKKIDRFLKNKLYSKILLEDEIATNIYTPKDILREHLLKS